MANNSPTTTSTLCYRKCESFTKLLLDKGTVSLEQVIGALEAAGIHCEELPTERSASKFIECPDGCQPIVPHEGATIRGVEVHRYNGGYFREHEDGTLTVYSYGKAIVTLDSRLRMRVAHIKRWIPTEHDIDSFTPATCQMVLSLYKQLDPDYCEDWKPARVREDYNNCLHRQGDKPKPCTYEDYSAN